MISIEPLEARIAPAVFTVTSANDSGAGSLRQAIADANGLAGFDLIEFEIPGSLFNARFIRLESPLPTITQPVTINGYTQPGSVQNTAEVGTNAELRIVIDGSAIEFQEANGLKIASNGVTITGLAIDGFSESNGFGGAGIYVQSGINVFIQGCFIGTDHTGTAGVGNEGGGIDIGQAATNVFIGGIGAASRNLISNNQNSGILASGTNVGIFGNLIGVGIDGISPSPNEGHGVRTENLVGGVIGGTVAAAENIIAHNEDAGIYALNTTSGLDIQQNSFFRNGSLAIDLNGDGVTLNDPLDIDTGANGRQNMPEITEVISENLGKVNFSVATSPNTEVRVDFYSSFNVDASGYGEGGDHIGVVTVMTNGFGFATGQLVLLDGIAPGTTITATATNTATSQTSEFSRGFNVNALTFVNSTTATWIDGDGDKVTLKITKGSLDESQFFFGPGNVQGSGVLQLLQLKDAEFDATDVTVTVKKAPFGDGRVTIGFIDAAGRDLGAVKIRGDLGRILCGDPDSSTISLKALTVNSFGLAGAFTLPDGIASSVVRGPVGSVSVAGNMTDVTFEVQPVQIFSPEEIAKTTVNSFRVGGNVTGNSIFSLISVDGNVNKLTIGGSLVGVGGVDITTNVGKVTIGSIYNSSLSLGKGLVDGTSQGSVTIKRDMVGGSITLGETVSKVTILGSLIGTNSGTGNISADKSLSAVIIRGDLIASRPSFTADVTGSATITSNKSIERVLIGGSIVVDESGNGSIRFSGRITAYDALGPVVIGKNVSGTEESPVIITGLGNEVKPTSGFDLAIRSVTIKGSATNTLIVAGLINTSSFNADASIGPVTVGKDWIASSIAAGVVDSGAPGFGVGDSLQVVDDTGLVARIASITIKGAFLPGSDPLMSYGFSAEEITRGTIGGARLPLDPGPSNDFGNPWTFKNLGYLEVP